VCRRTWLGKLTREARLRCRPSTLIRQNSSIHAFFDTRSFVYWRSKSSARLLARKTTPRSGMSGSRESILTRHERSALLRRSFPARRPFSLPFHPPRPACTCTVAACMQAEPGLAWLDAPKRLPARFRRCFVCRSSIPTPPPPLPLPPPPHRQPLRPLPLALCKQQRPLQPSPPRRSNLICLPTSWRLHQRPRRQQAQLGQASTRAGTAALCIRFGRLSSSAHTSHPPGSLCAFIDSSDADRCRAQRRFPSWLRLDARRCMERCSKWSECATLQVAYLCALL
jgi:hypothetical protein